MKTLSVRLSFLIAMSFVVGCAHAGADGCSWVEPIIVEENEIDRLSTNLLRQIVVHNTVVDEFCGSR